MGKLPAVRLNSSKEGRASGKDGEVGPDGHPETSNFTSMGLCFFSHQTRVRIVHLFVHPRPGLWNTAQSKMEGSLPSRHSYSYRGLIAEGIRAGHGSPGVWEWAWMDRESKGGQRGLPGGEWPQHTRSMSRVDQAKGR